MVGHTLYALFSTEPYVVQFEQISAPDGLQYQVIFGRYHGESAEQKGTGTILLPLWNRTDALS